MLSCLKCWLWLFFSFYFGFVDIVNVVVLISFEKSQKGLRLISQGILKLEAIKSNFTIRFILKRHTHTYISKNLFQSVSSKIKRKGGDKKLTFYFIYPMKVKTFNITHKTEIDNPRISCAKHTRNGE